MSSRWPTARPAALPEPIFALAHAAAPWRTCASVQLGNLALLKTRPLSKWITAERVAKDGSEGSSATFMSTVSFPTDFGLAAVPALLCASLTATDWWLLTAWASPAVPRERISAPARASAMVLRKWCS